LATFSDALFADGAAVPEKQTRLAQLRIRDRHRESTVRKKATNIRCGFFNLA
jgi:hypothetical protein